MSKSKRSDRYYVDGDDPSILPFHTKESECYNALAVRDVYEWLEETDRSCVKAKQIESDVEYSRTVIGQSLALISRETKLLGEYAPGRVRNTVYVINHE